MRSVRLMLAVTLVAGGSMFTASASPACVGQDHGFMAGAAKADITPVQWPVAMAAYSIGRMGTGAYDPFYARALAIRSCEDGSIAVFAALDSQGYFAAYKEDPGEGVNGLGLDAIRATVQQDTGVPADHITIASTHTHDSPDSVGLWGGSTTAANTAYLSVVKQGSIRAIEDALSQMRPATLKTGTDDIRDLQHTWYQVTDDPQHYPLDRTLRVLQVDGTDGSHISTLANVGAHATIAGELTQITRDWPGRLADDLDAHYGETSLVIPGGVGRTGPSFPPDRDPHSSDDLTRIRAYGDILAERADSAIANSTSITGDRIRVVDARLTEEVTEPAMLYLIYDEQGNQAFRGIMRSIVPPYTNGIDVGLETQTFGIGDAVFATTPAEAFPEVPVELGRRIHASTVFTLSLADDQIGYTPPSFEYATAWCFGGDAGLFTINPHFGDDLINHHLEAARALGFDAQGPYDGKTAGPLVPPSPGPCGSPI